MKFRLSGLIILLASIRANSALTKLTIALSVEKMRMAG